MWDLKSLISILPSSNIPPQFRTEPLMMRLFIALVLLAGAAEAQSTKRAFTPADWYRVTTVRQPAMSPDGKIVAFTVTTVRESENKRLSEVWAVSTNGGVPMRITPEGVESSTPRWTPDGKRLVFIRGILPEQRTAIVVLDIETRKERELASIARPAGPGSVAWSPDGRHVAVPVITPPPTGGTAIALFRFMAASAARCSSDVASRVRSSSPRPGITSGRFEASTAAIGFGSDEGVGAPRMSIGRSASCAGSRSCTCKR